MLTVTDEKHLGPVVLHADHGPALLLGRCQRLLGARDVVELAFGVVVQDQHPQRRAVGSPANASIGRSPLELPTDRIGRRPIRLQMPDRLLRAVVEEVHRGLVEQVRGVLAVAVLEAEGAADDPLRRHAVEVAGDRPHEVAVAAGRDVGR